MLQITFADMAPIYMLKKSYWETLCIVIWIWKHLDKESRILCCGCIAPLTDEQMDKLVKFRQNKVLLIHYD